MIIWPAFRIKKYRVNDHPYNAPQFTHRRNGHFQKITEIHIQSESVKIRELTLVIIFVIFIQKWKFRLKMKVLRVVQTLSHFIFEINVGKGRTRHTTTMNQNDEYPDRLKIDCRFKFRVVLCWIRPLPKLISKIKWFGSELPLKLIEFSLRVSEHHQQMSPTSLSPNIHPQSLTKTHS